MHTLTFAFYKAQGTKLNALIRWWTDSSYSHTEVRIPRMGNFSAGTRWQDGWKVRKAYFDLPASRWDLVYVPVSEEVLENVHAFACPLLGAKYDWLGIFGAQLLPWGIDDRRRYYCSELSCKIAQLAGVETTFHLQPHRTSPGDLADVMFGAGYEERR